MNRLERIVRSIFDAVIADCDPKASFERVVDVRRGEWTVGGSAIDLRDVDDVRVIAMGKPSLALLRACVQSLDRARVAAGMRRGVVALPLADVPAAQEIAGSWLRVVAAGHPTPDDGSFQAGHALLDLCSHPASDRTLVVALVGGGGSAMAEWPILRDATRVEFAALNDRLTRCDLSIREINAVRKRVSAIKGGRLAMASRPARVVTFVVADVALGDAGSVASGPTIEDDTTGDEALSAIPKLGFDESDTTSGMRLVQPANLVEPPTWTDADRARTRCVVLLDARAASTSAARHAADRADAVADLGVVDGPVASVAEAHLDALVRLTTANPGATCAVVSAGEATIDVRGSGHGGRNQHTALLALVQARESDEHLSDFAFLCAGTDGVDGNSSAAGAVVVPGLVEVARDRGLDPAASLAAFDSGGFFEALGAQVVCGPTGTNVRDLRVFVGIGR